MDSGGGDKLAAVKLDPKRIPPLLPLLGGEEDTALRRFSQARRSAPSTVHALLKSLSDFAGIRQEANGLFPRGLGLHESAVAA